MQLDSWFAVRFISGLRALVVAWFAVGGAHFSSILVSIGAQGFSGGCDSEWLGLRGFVFVYYRGGAGTSGFRFLLLLVSSWRGGMPVMVSIVWLVTGLLGLVCMVLGFVLAREDGNYLHLVGLLACLFGLLMSIFGFVGVGVG